MRAAALAFLLAGGCTPRPLLERAIHARGGPLLASVVRAETDVHVGAPGRWEWTRAFRSPDRYAWALVTNSVPHWHLFDGETVRSFVGEALVGVDPSPSAPLRSHARWTAVMDLDALRAPGVSLSPWTAGTLPPGVAEAVVATLPDGSRYELGFDEHALLVWARGPLDLRPIVKDEITARFDDFRRAGRLLVPFRTSYIVGEQALAEEHALAICVDPPGLGPEAFTAPGRLPTCP